MANPFAAAVLPNPVFEGSEKRLEIDFSYSLGSPAAGLRALSRAQLDELMTLAACTIVSSRSNSDLDAYVLSESSLFVYPSKWVLKTCGTTKLLAAVPRLLEMAAGLGMGPRRCKYSRASFLFPEQQPFPHTSFDQEAFYLRSHFGHLGNGGSAYVLGDMFNGLQWHVYVADANGAAYEPSPGSTVRPTYKMEMCMTELSPEAAALFFRSSDFVSAEAVTKASGIAALVPGMTIDDYVFEPCGYSMNGIRGGGFMTIHITPEAGFSYASVEVSGFGAGECDPADLAARVAAIFRPGRMSVSLSVDVASRSGGYSWGTLAYAPPGLGCQSATCQELAAGGRVSFYNFAAVADVGAQKVAAAQDVGVANGMGDVSMLPPAAAVGKGLTRCESPVTVLLRHMPSFSSLRSDSSDADASSSGDEHDCAGEWSRRIQGAQGMAERGAKAAAAAAAAANNGSFCPSF